MKKKRIIFIISLSCLILLSAGMILFYVLHTPDIVEDTYCFEEIQKSGILKVALIPSATDYCLFESQPKGFHLELFEHFAKDLGLDLKVLRANSNTEALTMLENHDVDIIVQNSIPTNTDCLSIPIIQTKQVLASRSEIPDSSWEIYVSEGYTDLNFTEQMALSAHLNAEIIEIDTLSQENLLKYFLDNEFEHILCDENIICQYQDSYRDIYINPDVEITQNVSWKAHYLNTQLLDSMNVWLEKTKETKFFRQLYHKYFDRSKINISSNLYSIGDGNISRYDKYIKKHSPKINLEWQLIASIIYEESRFNPEVVSYAGAYGLMQLMPALYSKYKYDPHTGIDGQIACGIKYIKFLEEKIPPEINDSLTIIRLVLASYNVGPAHIEDAIRLSEKYSDNPYIWDNISFYLKNLSNSKYYCDSVVKYGRFYGNRAIAFGNNIMKRYEHYKNLTAD